MAETARHLRNVHYLVPGAKLIAELNVLEFAALEAEAAAEAAADAAAAAAVVSDNNAVARMAEEADRVANDDAWITEGAAGMPEEVVGFAETSMLEASILAPCLTFEDVCGFGLDDREEAFLTIEDEVDSRRLFDGLFDWML
jgi:hypothetical protein